MDGPASWGWLPEESGLMPYRLLPSVPGRQPNTITTMIPRYGIRLSRTIHPDLSTSCPGIYSIAVESPGFAALKHEDIVVEVQQVVQQDFKLQVGDLRQQLTVTGDAPLLNTESTEIGDVISRDLTEQLPLNGRNFSQLALLVPGTNPGEVGGIRTQGGGNETERAGAEVIADGARGSFNLFMIDGIDDRDQTVGTLKVFPNLEDIAEFKVQIGNYDAEFASGGAVVNVVTRSGSNEIHGSAFEFLRNGALDARQFFDAEKPQFQQNQFGGAIGGPILRNKTFFFADYQSLRIHSATTSILSEPTPAMRVGGFSGYPAVLYDPRTWNAANNTRTPFPENSIPPSEIDPIARNLLATIPFPNLAGVSNNLRIDPLEVNAQNQFDIRADQIFSSGDSLFARFTDGGADITFPSTPVLIDGTINPLAFAQGTASLTMNHAPSLQTTVQETHQVTPNLVNQLALGYTRFYLRVTNLDEGMDIAQKLGLQGANTGPNAGAMAGLNVSGESGNASGALPEIVQQNTWQLTDTVSWTRGAHSLRMGLSAIQNRIGFFQLSAPSGSLSFTGAYTNNPAASAGTGAGFADFLLGLPVSAAKSSFPDGTPYARYGEYGAFVQDQWRATTHLTVNLGLRYDLFTPVSEQHNRQSDILFGSSLTGTNIMAIAGQNGISSSILDLRKHDFSPRIGLAYRLSNNTVLRAAYGLYYFNEEGSGGATRLFINYPFAAQYTVTCSATAPCLSTSTGIPGPAGATSLPTAVYQPVSNLTPNVQQWNLTLERQLASSLVIRASSVGSHGNHLDLNLNENVAVPGPGPVASRQPYPFYGVISAWEPRGISNYDGLQLSAEKRWSAGFSFLVAYTWSRSLDDGAGGNSSTGESRFNTQNPRDVAADYGLSNFDYRHRLTLSIAWPAPFGPGRKFLSKANRLLEALAAGWQFTSIVTAQSGAPFSLTLANPTANTGTFTAPDRVCDGNLPPGRQTIAEWFDISCFVNPPAYTFGNTGRNVLVGPGLFTWDLGAAKDFRLSEKFGLQLRGEFFNLLNRPNFDLPNGSIGSAASGTITNELTNARQIQFALRLHW